MENGTEIKSPAPNGPDTGRKNAAKKPVKRGGVLLPTILFLIILPLSIYALWQEKNKQVPEANYNIDAPIVLYYSNQCPHCKDLEKWIEENDIQNKIVFARKEVGSNRQNAEELMERTDICNISEDEVGVPFLWDGNTRKCLMGYDKITAYFQEKTSGNKADEASQNQTGQGKASITNNAKEK